MRIHLGHHGYDVPNWLGPVGIILKVAFAFAVVIWLSSFGGNRAKGAEFDSSVRVLIANIGQ